VPEVSPNRTRLLFVALVVAQLFLLAGQAPAQRGGNLLENTLLRILAPIGRLVAAGGDALSAARESVHTRGALERENSELREEVAELRREKLRLSGLELEAEEMARGLNFVAGSGLELRAARVVYFDRRSNLRSMLLEVGARRARVDQVVVAERGLVGRVVESAGAYAKVQLITDRAASVGVLLEGARRQGVLRGAGPGRLEVDYVPLQTRVEVGDRVVSAGIDGIYPRGLPVGVVTEVEPGSEMFHHVVVRPAVDFGNLSLVYLLESAKPPAALAREPDDAGR
jgi:rod shape-determining protein MreC